MADNETPQPPAGWYPDPTQPGQQRYWDGAQWTEHTAPGTGGDPGGAADSGTASGGDPSGGWDAGTGGSLGSPGGGFSAGDTGGVGGGGYGTGGAGGYQAAGYQGEKPDPWLWQSIVATILCCLPAGIVAIVFAAKAQSAIGSGNYAEARDNAGKAKTWTLVSIGLGLVAVVIWVLAVVVGGIGAGLDSGQF